MTQDLACFENQRFVPPSTCAPVNAHLRMLFESPFSWLKHIESNMRLPSNAQTQHLITLNKPSEAQLSTIFYPKQSALKSAIAYQVALLLNNMVQVQHQEPEQLQAWLKTAQVTDPVRLLKDLPVAVFDAFRERLFVLAVTAGDADIVTAMLELKIDPHVPIMTGVSGMLYPLEYAVLKDHFLVARKLLVHLLRSATQPLMQKLFSQVFKVTSTYYSSRTVNIQELACLLLEAGALPHSGCALAFEPGYSFEVWMRSSQVGLLPWLELTFSRTETYSLETSQGIRDDLHYLLHDRLQDLREECRDLEGLLSVRLEKALRDRKKSVLEIMLLAMTFLGCRDDSNYALCDPVDTAYREACDEGKWSLAASQMLTKETMTRKTASATQAEPLIPMWLEAILRETLEEEVFQGVAQEQHHDMHDDEYDEMLEERVQEWYSELTRDVHMAHNKHWHEWERINSVFRRALALGHVRVAIALYENEESDGWDLFAIMLGYGDAAICSEFLQALPAWWPLLRTVSEHDDISDIITIFYQNPLGLIMGAQVPSGGDKCFASRQICLRVLGYHAIATNAFILFQRLLDLGLSTDELWEYWDGSNEDNFVEKTSGLHGTDILAPCNHSEMGFECHIMPSLLSVAAGQNSLSWIDRLRAEGANMRDSMALLWAVRIGANIQTVKMLLQAARSQKGAVSDAYGSAALRQALRSHRLDIASLLCEAVNIDAIEKSTEECLDKATAVTPLGEGIIADNLEVVRWLLEHGANPNAYVARFGTLESIDSPLPLVTPLLAAIHKQSIFMIQLLVDFGATIEDTRKSGLTRTPLQRAAELGHFDIVKYFIDQFAKIDTVAAYSGGTALQLAAMNGHVGIATLLLERGADPNFLPAKGDGRTAFEAAIEWGRVDMVSLLMRSGVNLDLQVGDPPETQYERARRFAEKNGKFASKRMAERLYEQVKDSQRSAEVSELSFIVDTIDETWPLDPMPGLT